MLRDEPALGGLGDDGGGDDDGGDDDIGLSTLEKNAINFA